MADLATHYKAAPKRSICGRGNIPRNRLTTEFGMVSCGSCAAKIRKAGMQVLLGKEARGKA